MFTVIHVLVKPFENQGSYWIYIIYDRCENDSFKFLCKVRCKLVVHVYIIVVEMSHLQPYSKQGVYWCVLCIMDLWFNHSCSEREITFKNLSEKLISWFTNDKLGLVDCYYGTV